MDKTKLKSKGLIKATAAGFALMLATAFFPANAIAQAADYTGLSQVNNNTTRIEVGVDEQKGESINVKKGQTVNIPTGVFYKNGVEYTIGVTSASSDGIERFVKVLYPDTNDELTDLVGNQFVANRVGRYVIVYTVIDNGVEYSYEMNVNCQASEANFEFETNSSNIIPSVYDISLANSSDIVLPLPKVVDEDGEAIISPEDTEYYLLSKTNFEDTQSKNAYVKISISNAGKDVPIVPVMEGEEVVGYKIPGDKLSVDALSGQEFKVYYSFYQEGSQADKDVFVSSVSKSFTVKSNHYYKSSNKTDSNKGYELETTFSSSTSSLTAVVGVERDLPKVTATTKASNSPASENVEVYYEIKVTRDNEDVTADVINEDGKFKADAEGTYKFVYTVKDFYGNIADTTKTSFFIEKVKDSRSANVYMYDAGNTNAFNAEDNKYESAENLLKSQSANRNIVMYAVGGTDNMVAKENLTLRREIKNNSSVTMFKVEEKAYNEYNLIFAPAVASGETTMDNIYKQIVADNFEIYKQMLQAEEGENDVTSPAEIKAFLASHNYLLVTTEENKFNDETIVTKDGEVTPADYIAAGFAYVKPENSKNKVFTSQTYSFYYYANDNINKEKSVYYTVKVDENMVEETEVPTITFSSDLQVAYLPTDSFEFNVATANDTQDTRIKAVTAYRYLNSKKEAMASNQTTKTLNYVVKNSKDDTKWYAGKATNGVVSSYGWYVDESKSTYSIDLANRPYNDVDGYAQYVEVLAYAIDDYGNAGFYSNIIEIANAEDVDMPELYKVENAPDGSIEYEAPMTITLPTLYFEDANTNYMHANVAVYKLTENGKVRMQSSNMSTEFDNKFTDTYKVTAGSFHASTAGKYQVAVTVTDSGNHSVTTYFDYEVSGRVVIEEPEITNISADTIKLDAGKSHYLVPPTIDMGETEGYGFIGLSDDDSNVCTNYTTTVISATGDYTLDQYYFKGNETGLYQLQYKVYLLQYKLNAVKDAPVNGDLFFDANGSLKFKYNDTEYFVYIDRVNANDEENPTLANTSKQGIGDSISSAGLVELKKLVHSYAIESRVQTINVGGVEMEVSLDDNAYSDSYTGEVGPVQIVKPTNVSYNGSSYKTNNEKSTVTITKTTGSTTTTIAELNFADWEEDVKNNTDFVVNGKDVFLKLAGNGKYTIKYSIQAMDKSGLNVGSAKTMEYTFSYGDVIAPELELKSNLVKAKYHINDTMSINLAGISVSDLGTTDKDKLLDSMVVELENTDLEDGSVKLDPVEEGSHAYSYKFTKAGSYTLKITVTDEAGNKTTEKVSFEVTTEEKASVDVKEVMGGVLIGLSVAILAGVVIYFVVSKVKLDKKEKSYRSGNDKK